MVSGTTRWWDRCFVSISITSHLPSLRAKNSGCYIGCYIWADGFTIKTPQVTKEAARDVPRGWSGAGGEIRTLNPSRGLVFETSAYTVPPHRLVNCMLPHLMQEVNMRCLKIQALSRISQYS